MSVDVVCWPADVLRRPVDVLCRPVDVVCRPAYVGGVSEIHSGGPPSCFGFSRVSFA